MSRPERGATRGPVRWTWRPGRRLAHVVRPDLAAIRRRGQSFGRRSLTEEEKTAEWEALDRVRSAGRARIRAEVAATFRDQERDVLARLEGLTGRAFTAAPGALPQAFPEWIQQEPDGPLVPDHPASQAWEAAGLTREAGGPDDPVVGVGVAQVFDVARWAQEQAERWGPLVEEVAAVGYKAGAAQVGEDRPPVDWRLSGDALEELNAKIRGVAEDTRKELNRVIQKALAAGLTNRDLAILIRAKFDEFSTSRADRIAQTSATAAFSAAQDQAHADAGAPGSVWLTQRDGHVRPTHLAADGRQKERDGTFRVGSARLRWPGDPLAPAREVVNCRCGLLPMAPGAIPDPDAPGFVSDEEAEAGARPAPKAQTDKTQGPQTAPQVAPDPPEPAGPDRVAPSSKVRLKRADFPTMFDQVEAAFKALDQTFKIPAEFLDLHVEEYAPRDATWSGFFSRPWTWPKDGPPGKRGGGGMIGINPAYRDRPAHMAHTLAHEWGHYFDSEMTIRDGDFILAKDALTGSDIRHVYGLSERAWVNAKTTAERRLDLVDLEAALKEEELAGATTAQKAPLVKAIERARWFYANPGATVMDDWAKAVRKTQAYEKLKAMAEDRAPFLDNFDPVRRNQFVEWARYAITPDEFWARSFEQWVATKPWAAKGHRAFYDEEVARLKAAGLDVDGGYWTWEDFREVAEALDRIFSRPEFQRALVVSFRAFWTHLAGPS